MLGREDLTDDARVVVEKPFGTDLESSRELDAALKDVIERGAGLPHRPLPGQGGGAEHPGAAVRQRPDRAGLEPRAPGRRCRSTCPRSSTVEGRGSFYESTGCFRDMISTHLCQVLGFVAMEPPGAPRRDRRCATRRPRCSRRCSRSTPSGSCSGSTRATATRTDVDRRLDGRDLRRARGLRRHRPLAGRAVLPAHRQGAGRHPAHRHADASARRRLGPIRRQRATAPTSWSSS